MARTLSSTLRRWGSRLRSREGLALLVVLLVAALVRGAYLAHFAGAPDFEHPAIDAGFHDYWARTIAFPGTEPPEHVADPELATSPYLRPPGYAYFLAAIYALSGGSYLAPRIVQLLLGLVTVALTFAAGRRTFGPLAGVAAAALVATCAPVVYFEGELHAETLLLPLLLALYLAVLRLRRDPSLRLALLCGVLLGAAALVRTNAAAYAALVPLWLWWRTRREWPVRRLLAVVGAYLLAAAVAISPATIRNAVVAGELVPISSNLGINLLLGNHPRATPFVGQEVEGLGRFETCYDYPALVDALERKLGRRLTDSEASRHFTGEALAWIGANPGDFLRLTARKAVSFWGPAEVSHNKVVALELEHSAVLRALPSGFAVVAFLAGLGLLVWWLRCRASGRTGRADRAPPECAAEPGLLVVFVLGWFLSVLPFFVASRYRLPLVPFLALPAGYGAVLWIESIVLRFGRLVGAANVAVLFFIGWVVSHAALELGSPNEVKWHMDRGRAFNRGGDVERAIAEFEAALTVSPGSAEAHFSLGHSMVLLGNLDAARREFEETVRLHPDHASALQNLGSLEARRGGFDLAVGYFERLVLLQPYSAEGWRNLALAQTRTGALADAAASYGRAVEAAPGDVATRRVYASVLLALHRHGEALAQLREALRLEPAQPLNAVELARLLATAPDDRLRDGAEALRLAEAASRALGGRHPDALEALAAAQAETGRFSEAATTAAQALELARAAGQQALAARIASALEAYRAGRAFRLP